MVKNIYRFLGLFVLTLIVAKQCVAEDLSYGKHAQAKSFIDKMVVEHGFERSYIQGLMSNAQRKQSILDAIARPAEKTKTWGEYRKIFVTQVRIDQGRDFLKTYADPLARAERDFGVPKEIISAIIGVETRYGRHKGNYRVLDALATLSFDYPPRSAFFSKELEEYLLLVKEQKFDPKEVKGSYAGAMGYGQFISSSYRHYAVDYDGDGIADIITNPVDAIGSVANYFKAHDWLPGEAITVLASVTDKYNAEIANQKLKPKYTVDELKQQGYAGLEVVDGAQLATAMRLDGDEGDEYWLGMENFYVITRYNHSRMYAMAVYQLSEALKQP